MTVPLGPYPLKFLPLLLNRESSFQSGNEYGKAGPVVNRYAIFGVRSQHSRNWVLQSRRRHRSLRNSATTTAGSVLNWTISYKVSVSDSNSKELSPFQFWPTTVSALVSRGQCYSFRQWRPLNLITNPPHFTERYIILQRLRWSRGSVLAFSTQVRGFKPGRSRRVFKGEKILSTPSFGGEVKPSVPCRRVAACKRSLMAWIETPCRQYYRTTFLAHSSTFRC